jgi:DeoR/GlpR family transcriptional regulator of sugar metabolism
VEGTKHGNLSDIDVLISDTGLADDHYRQLLSAGIEVERA